jgi:hypothetical protein
MDWTVVASWAGAVVSLLSLAATLWLQWWRRPTVDWICDGWMNKRGAIGSRVREGGFPVYLTLANCGDGAAFGVETLRCHGGAKEPYRVFEAGVVPAGGQIEVRLMVELADLESAWVEVDYTSSPTLRSTRRHSRRFYPAVELADHARRRPGYDPTQVGPQWGETSRIPGPIATRQEDDHGPGDAQ